MKLVALFLAWFFGLNMIILLAYGEFGVAAIAGICSGALFGFALRD